MTICECLRRSTGPYVAKPHTFPAQIHDRQCLNNGGVFALPAGVLPTVKAFKGELNTYLGQLSEMRAQR